MKNTKLRKALSVFLSVLTLMSCWVWVAPTDASAANKYYVKVYVNIYDGSDGYGGTYSVEESTGKPKNYSWATNDGWYGRVNMTGFTVFGEKGDYDAQDVSAALLEAEKLNTWYAMSGLSDNNNGGDWDSTAIAQKVYTFTLDSFPVEVFWMNDENNWDGGNTGFAIRKLTVATSENGVEHTMWEGLAGSDSQTYNYYGSITPTGIHTCFEDYAKNYDMNDYNFYKAITTSSQRQWTDPYTYGSAGTYYLNEYANGGVSATFSEGTSSVASTVDYIDTSSSDTYYVNFTNHSKTQAAVITGIYNNGNFVTSPVDSTESNPLKPGETRSFEINKSNYGKLAKYNGAANFTFEYTLSDVYASDELNAPLAKFIQPTYIGLWNESSYSKSGTTFSLNNIGNLQVTFQTTEGILETVSTPSGKVDHASVEYRYYIDNSVANNSWEKTGLRFYITETNNSRVHFQNKNKTAGTMRFSGPITNTSTASLKMADFAFNSVTENFVYNVSATATYNNTVTPTWEPKTSDSFATLYNDNPAWVRFGGTTFEIDPSADNQYATILLSDMLFNDYYNYQAKFSASIDVYAVNKAELRKYVRETLLDFAPMSLRYTTTAFETYQNKLAAAMNVLADQKTTQKAVTNALAELKSAVEDLQSTDNLINQVAELTHVQYVDDIGSEVAASIPERYVLIPLGEHTVPQNTAYIGNGTYKDATNKKSNLTTNYAKTDTAIETLKYYYWNIEFAEYDENRSVVDFTIENLETAIAGFDSNIYSNDYYKALVEAKKALEAIDQNDGTNSPSTQEEVESAIINADSLLAHLGNNMRVHKWKEDTDGNYIAQKDEKTHWYTCTICGYELVYNHYFEYEKIDNAQHKATCVTSGTDEGCGYTFNEDHIWVEGETVATSCTEGNINYSCVCGATKTEATIVSNHNFAITDNEDGTHISKCSVCGANEPDATAEAHTYTYTNNNDGTHTATCSVCKATETVAHIFENPVLARPTLVDGTWNSGTYTSYCVCGAEKVEPAERADYSELDEIVEALKGLQDNENLTDEAKKAITDAIAKDDALADDLVTAEQKDIDDLVKELQKVKADVDEAIKNKEIGVEKITEANSGVKVQFIDKSGLGAIDSIQLGKDDGFIIRVANGNADSDITIKELNGTDVNKTLGSGESTDFNIDATGLTAGIATYTVTYTIDGLKDANGNLVEFTTEAYIYVKAEAYQPYHYVDEDCANGSATSEWAYSLEATVGDFALVYNYKAPKAEFGNDNLVREKALALSNFTYYDYEDDKCFAGCSDAGWKKGDAHAATYRFYIDTSIASTWQDAGLTAAFAETDKSNYDNAAIEYIRLANNEFYLNNINGTDKTFTVTFMPGKSTNVPNMTWFNQTAGDMAVAEYINPDQNNYLFGQKLVDDGKELNTAYAAFTGEIPQKTEDAKLMFSPRLVYKKAAEGFLGIQGAQNEAVTMTTHLYITSYDKGALRSAVEAAETAGYNSAYFNAEKYEAYENALKTAKEVLGKAETNQGEIDAAVAALNTAIADLTKAENKAKFVLTVTHSIHENADKNSEATSTLTDYYLVNGEITPALDEATTNLTTINKYDAPAKLNITADAEHTYNYWYIDYSGVQDAIAEAQNIIDNADKYDPDFVTAVTNAKNALEVIKNGESATTTPESQDDVDNAIKGVTDLTGHGCADKDIDHDCDICGATIGTHEDVDPEDHNCDYCGGKITDCADTDKNHKCDICGATMGTHADSATDSDHVCDYGCGVTLENCTDVDTDTDHNCDICGAENVTSHNYVNPVLTRPTKNEDGTWKKGYYTSTCNCGATKTETAERATYTEYDSAKAALEALKENASITAEAKAEIEAVLEANKIADDYIATEEEQAIVDAAAAALKAELDKLTDEEGKLEDEYKKPSSDAAKEAVEAAEALDKEIGLTPEDKEALEDLRDRLDEVLAGIEADTTPTAAEYQETLDQIETEAKDILDNYTDCSEGGHAWVETNLVRPTQNEDGTWNSGTYTYTCENCGATKTETAERATYTEYDSAKAALEALKENASITAEAKAEIEAVLEANKIADDYIATEEEQAIVDAAAAALKAELEKLTNEDGSLKDEYKKPDAECKHNNCAVTVVAPTCHSLGYTLHVCKNCGYAYRTDEQPATDDHKWGRWFETESGSCLEYRMHERSCLNEGCYEKQIEIMRDANGDALYGKHYVVVIKGQAATCVTPGYTDYERCVVCGEITEAEVIPATGHIDNNKNGNCDVCNYVTNPSIGKCDCLCHNDSFFGKLLYNFVNFFWKLFKIQQGCQCGAQHW